MAFKCSAIKIITNLHDFRLYLLFLFILSIYYLSQWPIISLDTDLWYHLAHGKYILDNNSIPDKSYFSFISPYLTWVDYYWLFQVLVFKIYSWANYDGLIILRAIIFLATLFFVFFLLFHHQNKESHFYLSLIFAFLVLILLPRYQLIRPHIFSYLFILLFLYILECKPDKAFLLPIFAVLWANIHGIEYPVLFLICLAYIAQFFLNHFLNKRHLEKNELAYILPLILSLTAIYLTPHGSKLIEVPFVSTENASQYINELRPIKFLDFFYFHFTKPDPTILNIFFVLIFSSTAISIAHKKIKISHLLLLAGGIFLLTKGIRFIYEFVLLSLPILQAFPLRISLKGLTQRTKIIAVSGMILILCLPLISLMNFFKNPSRYPLSFVNLPAGITTFLNHISVGGYVLNHPNNGGYLIWELYPQYKIFMDMEVPFLFKDEDFFMAANAFSNEEVLRKIISKYNPSFISVPIAKKDFREIIKKFPEYIMVFFDSAEVLYLNKKHYPELAPKYKLDIDPFEMLNKPIEAIINLKGKEILLRDLGKLTEIYPDCMTTNQILAMYYNKEEQYEKAIFHAEKLINNYPDAPMGYRLKGIALKGMKLPDDALYFMKKALEKTSDEGKRELYKQMAYIYTQKKEYKKAYKFFKKGIPVFSSETTYQELFDLSSGAILVNKIEDAIFFLNLAQAKVPQEDKKFFERIKKQLHHLGVKEK